jgi:glycosyltransferase involved in cell wall biosynthesis
MRILNLEGEYFVPALKKAGHKVLSIGYSENCDLKLKKLLGPKELISFLDSKGFVPDLILWNDLCRPPGVVGFEKLPCLCMGFSIDQYCNPWQVPFSACFDLFLVAQKDYLPLFMDLELPRPVLWFPLFFDPGKAFDEGLSRDIPISFVGTLDGVYNQSRRKFLLACQKRLPLIIRQGAYQPIYARSKIVLNQSAAGELNFRIFEAAACGAAVLTENVDNGLRDLFVPGEEILVYERGNVTSAVTVARKALESKELQEIALAGKRKVQREHSIGARVKTILEKAKELLAQRAYQWRLENKKFVAKELAKTFYFLSVDENLNLPLDLRQKYLEAGCFYRELL